MNFEYSISNLVLPSHADSWSPNANANKSGLRQSRSRTASNLVSEIQQFAGETLSWNEKADIIIKAYSQIIPEKDPGLISKMEKHHERPLSLNSHSGLQC